MRKHPFQHRTLEPAVMGRAVMERAAMHHVAILHPARDVLRAVMERAAMHHVAILHAACDALRAACVGRRPAISRLVLRVLAHARALGRIHTNALALLPLRRGIQFQRQSMDTARTHNVLKQSIHQPMTLHPQFSVKGIRNHAHPKVALTSRRTRMLVAFVQYF